MPLDQIALLSFTSTRTSEVFMVFWANFFTCVCESAGVGVSGVSSHATMDGKRDDGCVGKPDRGAGRKGRMRRDNAGARSHELPRDRARRAGVAARSHARAPANDARRSPRKSRVLGCREGRTAATARGALFLKVIP